MTEIVQNMEKPPLPAGATDQSLTLRPFMGYYWNASLKKTFKSWAVGFKCPDPSTVLGAEFFLQNVQCACIFVIRFYNIFGNPDFFDISKNNAILEFSFLAKNLDIYADKLPVFFRMDISSLTQGLSYLIQIQADTWLGMGISDNILPKENNFHRGYFNMDESHILLPVNASIAWRLIYKN